MESGRGDPTSYLEYLREQGREIDEQRVPMAALEEALADRRVVLTDAGEAAILQHVAYLWACGLLDARTWTLLFPILIAIRELREGESLVVFLERRSEELGWGLGAGFFREKLESGAGLVLIDGVEESTAGVVEAAMREWPGCRFIVAGRSGELPGFESVEVAR